MHRFVLGSTFLCILVCAGCRKETADVRFAAPNHNVSPGQIITNSTKISYSALPDNAVLVNVGGRILRKDQVESHVSITLDLIRRNAKSASEAEDVIRKSNDALRERVISYFISSSAFNLEAKKLKIQPSKVMLESASTIITNLCRGLKCSYDELVKRYPGGAAGLSSNILFEAENKELFVRMFGDKLKVSESDVDKLHADLLKANSDSQRTNEQIRASFLSFREKILPQLLAFTDDAESNSRLVPTGFEVQVFSDQPANGFDDDELVPEVLRKSKLGVWSEIVELDDSFQMFRVDRIAPRSHNVPTLYSGVCISHAKDLGYIVPTKAELRIDMARRKNAQLVIPESERFQKKFGVCYPYGFVWVPERKPKNLFPKAMKKGIK